jgi:hypothetical protein
MRQQARPVPTMPHQQPARKANNASLAIAWRRSRIGPLCGPSTISAPRNRLEPPRRLRRPFRPAALDLGALGGVGKVPIDRFGLIPATARPAPAEIVALQAGIELPERPGAITRIVDGEIPIGQQLGTVALPHRAGVRLVLEARIIGTAETIEPGEQQRPLAIIEPAAAPAPDSPLLVGTPISPAPWWRARDLDQRRLDRLGIRRSRALR